MERITIVGMGPLGASIGMGLKRAGLKDTEIVGADGDRDALSRASASGAVDRTVHNLRTAFEGAQLVVLDWPLSETRALMEAVAPMLREGCVVTDTGLAKVEVMRWAETFFAPGVDFVGGRPLPGKAPEKDSPDPSIFHGADYCVVPSESAGPESVKTVVGMVEALGANPYFLDAREHDSYTAAVTLLPMMMSSALVTSEASSSSWREMSRLAGAEFRRATESVRIDPEDSAAACLAGGEGLVHWLDVLLAELGAYRTAVQQGGDRLLESFILAWEERSRWDMGEVSRESPPQARSAAQTMAGTLVGSHVVDRYRSLAGSRKRPRWKYPSTKS